MNRRAFMAAIGLSPLGLIPAAAVAASPKKETELVVTISRGADIAQVQKWAREIEASLAESKWRRERGVIQSFRASPGSRIVI